MSIIAWIVLGAIAGYLAGFLVRGDEGLGVIGHIVLGIVGALVGGFLAGALFGNNPIDGPLDISSIVAAVIGAVIVVARGECRHGQLAAQHGLTRHRTAVGPDPVRRGAHRSPRWASACPSPNPEHHPEGAPHVEDRDARSTSHVPVREAYDQWTQFEDVPAVHGRRRVASSSSTTRTSTGSRRSPASARSGTRRSRSRSRTSGSRGRRPTATGTPASVDFHRVDDRDDARHAARWTSSPRASVERVGDALGVAGPAGRGRPRAVQGVHRVARRARRARGAARSSRPM